MDKYKTKMTINKWFSYIKLEQLSFDSRQAIEQFEVSPASKHDHEHLEVFINEPLATYVFDRGYLDFAQFDQMHWDGYFFVSRIKKNTTVHVQGHLAVPKGTAIISDQVGSIG